MFVLHVFVWGSCFCFCIPSAPPPVLLHNFVSHTHNFVTHHLSHGTPWQVWRLVTSNFVLRGKRGTCSHQPSFCVAGVALMTLGWIWWRAWSPLVARGAAALCVAGVALNTSTFVLRGRRGAYDTGLDLVARLEPVSRPWRRGTLRGRRGT